jgi:hypothetical protein
VRRSHTGQSLVCYAPLLLLLSRGGFQQE